MRHMILLLSLVSAASAQDLRLPALFADHMVLQRNREVAIWGNAKAGAAVDVRASWGASATTKADAAGKWRTGLRTPGASAGHEVIITSDAATITLEDVLCGDVWLCSGQSNMEMVVNSIRPEDRDRELADAALPRVRLFTVANAIAPAPRPDVEGAWTACTEDSVRGFSAAGYFFGKTIHRALGIPVGLIAADWGGTVCESWTSRGALEAHGGFDAALKEVDLLVTDASDVARRQAAARAKWWAGANKDLAWTRPQFSDAPWQDLAAPGLWEKTAIGNFDGFVFLRRTVELPADWSGNELTLELGPVDDMDTTWFNGRKVGGIEVPGFWNVPRRYVIPGSAVKAGKNVIAVRCLDTGGAGGFAGDKNSMLIQRGDGKGEPIVLAGTWKAMKGPLAGKLPRFPTGPRLHANAPTALHNGMIAPLIPFGLRGFLWYQGESNRERGLQYRTLFPAMINDWRSRFGQGPLPFYFVQIAPYSYGGDEGQAAELREAQLMTLSLENTGMACTMDIGNPRDIHPKSKQEVGRRLALWALAREYGNKDVVYSGPLYKSMTIEGKTIRIHFDHADGLVARGGPPPSHFTIAGSDGGFVPAVARIDGKTIVVSSPRVPQPAAVRYGWGAADEPNLFNGGGLPASSFRTDDLPRSLKRR